MANENLTNLIRSAIEADIQMGRLMPGDTIDERSLAAQFSVSRTPVRQALQQLHGQRIIEVQPRQGARVPKLDVKDLLSIFELLAELEGLAARFAARRITSIKAAELAQAQTNYKRCAEAGTPEQYTQTNRDFHEKIYSFAQNPFLAREICDLRQKRRSYEYNRFKRPNGMKRSADEHDAIVDAITQGDEEAAFNTARGHILNGADSFLDYVAQLRDG